MFTLKDLDVQHVELRKHMIAGRTRRFVLDLYVHLEPEHEVPRAVSVCIGMPISMYGVRPLQRFAAARRAFVGHH